MRMTKIVCTIGPASRDVATLEKLMRAGMNVARLNFSHGTQEEKGRTIADIRAIAKKLGLPVAILQDLAGPKIRTGAIAGGPVTLISGGIFILTNRPVPGSAREVSLTYRALPRDVKKGDSILLNDGAIELTVEEARERDIRCRVIVGGELSSHKGINLPGRSVGAGTLTAKDRSDLAFGLKQGVDYVALSFVRSAKDVASARAVMKKVNRSAPIIAKIEKHEALRNIDEIVDAVDGVMVARGDLGVEIPIEDVPRMQKMIIGKANCACKPVITATQMLKSMVDSPRPTRAEVTDVANAVLDGSDAVMLSEETAAGRYPVQAVAMMSKVIVAAEKMFPFRAWTAKFGEAVQAAPQEAVAHAACHLAEDIGAAAVITCTQSGSTTRRVAKYRPFQPILAMTPDEKTLRAMALVWGAVPILMGPASDVSAMERAAVRLARAGKHVKRGDQVVMTAGVPLHVTGTTNLVRVLTVE